MSEHLKEIYDRIYGAKEITYGEGQPADILVKAMEYLNHGSALEIGSGEGRNSLFLASEGFQVTAVDLSEVGMDKLKAKLEENNLTAEIIISDIIEFDFTTNYDLIISTYTLFHLSKEKALALIEKIKSHTTVGGLNILTTFTEQSDFYTLGHGENEFYCKPNQLKTLYSDWEILKYEEVEVETNNKREDGSFMVNTAAEIIARKK